MPIDFRNKRVTVMGLGSFGGQIAAIRFLSRQGVREIIVTDTKTADQLKDSLAQIADVPNVTLHLDSHVEDDFTKSDAIVVSPAVPKSSRWLAAARAAGVPLTSEMNLFFERCPAKIVGITGSVGKSTTTAMIEAVLTRASRAVPAPGASLGLIHLGGNIGHRALLPNLGKIAPGDTVILELSSFQLEDLGELERSPQIAVVTNLAPNHLDRHGTMDEYARCKQNILRFQQPGDLAVLNAEDPAVAQWASLTPAKVVWYRAADAAGVKLRVVGRHNRSNAAAALAVGRELAVPDDVMAAALAEFHSLPDRLELLDEIAGVRYFNDSKSTTPDSAMTALRAFEDTPVVLIVGGYDKKIDLEPLCRELATTAKAVLAIGQTGPRFCELVRKHRPAGAATGVVQLVGDLPAAVKVASSFAAPGDAVVLSPACASYDQFENYEQRGQAFRALVAQMRSQNR